MGIKGLLTFVKPASKDCHISEFRGKTVAIDSYCWLHRGAFGCAEKLAKGEETDAYVTYCFKYIDMLLAFKIKPIMVFDGRNLPAKIVTEQKRRQIRKQARKLAMDSMKLGDMEEARANFKKCINITSEMAFKLIKECRNRNIDCIVAPYEADAQLAYLNRSHIAHFVITEDSDLLLFGCSNILYKLTLAGRGTLVEAEKLYLATNESPEMFSFERFRYMCILSGCDYLESLPGIGLKKAYKFLKRNHDSDMYNAIAKLPSILNKRELIVSEEYRHQFMIADATFQHQLVFDPLERRLLPLTDPKSCGTNPEYCCNAGKVLDEKIAYQIALGNMNPFTFHVFDNWCPDTALQARVNQSDSIWSKFYKMSRSDLKSPAKKRVRYSLNKNKNLECKIEIINPEHNEDKSDEDLLKLYASAEPAPKRLCIRSSIEDTEAKKEGTSPILVEQNKPVNPFIKNVNTNILKKLSNFERTVLDKTSIVTSKFFSSQSSSGSTLENSETSTQNEIADSYYDTDELASSNETDNNVAEKDDIHKNEECDIREIEECDKIDVEENDSNNSGTTLNNNKEILISDTASMSKKLIDNKLDTSDCLPAKQTIMQNNNSTLPKNKVGNRMPTCRRLGLSKKFAKSKNQQTLLNMFGFKKS